MLFSLNVDASENPSTAFYYAENPPLELLSEYQRVVVEPENILANQLKVLQQRGVIVYAYLSIGEVGANRVWYKQIKAEWKKGVNSAWNSAVMDMTSTDWHDFLLDKKMKKLWQQGYRGFFLDTMDSYQLFAKTEPEQSQQKAGMVKLLRAMSQKYKGVQLLFNRGFEILDQVAGLSDGLVAESLFSGWDAGENEYIVISTKDREWLLGKLKQAQDKYLLSVTVIDYVPSNNKEQAKKIADKISQAGFVPWVSTPKLDSMGVGRN